jgi:hypothetical protein
MEHSWSVGVGSAGVQPALRKATIVLFRTIFIPLKTIDAIYYMYVIDGEALGVRQQSCRLLF